jgi:pimeloyl-ACP methyl ester carboxylesterase
MIAELTLPRLGETMETGRVTAWLKQPGQAFKRGETLVEIESDKTVVEMPALSDGVLAEIVVAAGEDDDVGAVLCRYEDGREQPVQAAAPATEAALGPEISAPRAPEAAAADAPVSASREAGAGGLRATPLARRIARQHGIALPDVSGSGRRGRIEAADVEAVAGTGPGSDSGFSSGAGLNRRDWPAVAPHGPRLVLLHGIAADLQSWAALAPSLARNGRAVTAIDLPGHGDTAQEATDPDRMVDAVIGFLATLGQDPVELVGHSLGGAIATRVARRAPGRVARLTLLAPAGLDRAIDVDFIRSIVGVRSAGALSHLLRRLVVRPAPTTAAQLDSLAATLARGRLAALAEALVDATGQQIDITADLRALSIPVRIIWGLQDRIIPWTQASQAPSHCAIHLIQDAGHVPHWDQPAEVASLLS